MPEAALGKDLERRKQLRLRLRADLEIEPHKYEGRTYYIVKDPISLRYYRFTEQEHFILRLLDGQQTLDESQKTFEQFYRPERLQLEELEVFAQQLLLTGLAHNESPQAGPQLFERRRKRRRQELLQALTSILYIKIPAFDPDAFLTRMLPWLRWMFTPWFAALSIGVFLAALLLVATHFEAFRDRLPAARDFFRLQTVAYMWLALGVVKVIHEFGHGLSCKAFGGEVHEMGALLLCFSPALYCNVSDAWTMPNKWKRMLISFAGIYVELIMASLATFLWWNTANQPFIHNLCLSMMVVCSANTLMINGNPLMRFDGYYVMADWMEIPNLREQTRRYVTTLIQEQCLGIEIPPEPYMAMGRRVLFVVYAVVSYVYTWTITFGILYVLHTMLKPHKLGAVGTLLAVAAGASMVCWPIFGLGKSIHRRGGRLPEMKPLRVTLSVGVIVLFLLGLILVPLPVSRIRQDAVVQVQPEAAQQVFVPYPGILESVHVREGQRVAKNDILAEFSSLDLEEELAKARTEEKISLVEGQSLRQQEADTLDPQERAKLDVSLSAAVGDSLRYGRQVVLYSNTLQHLVLRAPCPGVVMGLPHPDEVGRRWEKEQDAPFCSIGDPRRLRALMPLTPAEFRLLKDDLETARLAGSDLDVAIRVQGREGDNWKGKVGSLPESEAREVPFGLTTKAGGPLPVKPGLKPTVFEPQSQQYLVPIDFLEPDRALCPGTLAKVKIHCRWRTGAWWAWRTVSSAFDLGLL